MMHDPSRRQGMELRAWVRYAGEVGVGRGWPDTQGKRAINGGR